MIFIKITITSQVEYELVIEWNTVSTEKAQSGPAVLTQKDTQSRESKRMYSCCLRKPGWNWGDGSKLKALARGPEFGFPHTT